MLTVRKLLVFLLGVALASPGFGSIQAQTSQKQDLSADASVGLEPHPSVLIEGDRELANSSVVRGGSGTVDDPYVISDWHITRTDYYGIRILNTDAHVHIENVFIDGKRDVVKDARQVAGILGLDELEDLTIGLDLLGTSNVSADGLRALDADIGVAISDSTEVEIRDLKIGELTSEKLQPAFRLTQNYRSSDFGMTVAYSSNITVEDASIHTSWRPFTATQTTDITIANSSIVGIGQDDPRHGSSSASISDSDEVSVRQVSFNGTQLRLNGEVPTVEVLESRFKEVRRAVVTSDTPWTEFSADRLSFCGNEFDEIERRYSNELTGVALRILYDVDDLEVIGNSFVGGDYGMTVTSQTHNLTIRKSEFSNNSVRGMSVSPVNAEIANNSIEDNNIGASVADAGNQDQDIQITENWWGDESGPNVTGLDVSGPGTGDILEVSKVSPDDISWKPWLEEPPEAGPDAVDCVPGDTLGATHGAPVTTGLALSGEVQAELNEDAGPADLEAETKATVEAEERVPVR